MDNAIYAALTRQAGLMREMRAVANNMANSSTTGFRREGVVFSEHMTPLGGRSTLSMANAHGREVDLSPAPLAQTGGKLDLALEREGFFMVQTPQGNRLTRAGAFMASAEGELVNADGHRVLDDGEAPIALPPGARNIGVGPDGTISADGEPVGRVGIFAQPDPTRLRHEGGTLFAAEGAMPAPEAVVRQGFLEESNVNPVLEIARMIEVQRAYELGQSFLDGEDQRIRAAIAATTR
ncbi:MULTISPECIES: flagellar hook-basal body complex protein [unclassified Paracoccus (in: a-proteobacteria)]|uniref:flagellar hook-basal body complex protein n=1 Tax=unclassified Paracoccus (in: a-proteobacteria) TaxID=2688777 RepID=UPI0016022B32|nr:MULTISPECIES: flagellar hook-basal body complex protein [unclassified Paracoccus (in: a-proteobacteria)]MBB1490787.1 flagellar hook-basal body complex protein [Paracoccus sp. MC1854]MBB1497370.1 flagellar hook-basal body complex protein [Paracoccus sp. MC1862]QQO45863.1 flagellar hook-basal body complex protein [Paracoccus sp. MC1862]